ncbi:MAG: hypothetical protein AAFU49_21845 [Pseudomonadota bacterium]
MYPVVLKRYSKLSGVFTHRKAIRFFAGVLTPYATGRRHRQEQDQRFNGVTLAASHRRYITITPISPKATAPICHGPTLSPKTGSASKVMNSEAMKKTTIASAGLFTERVVKHEIFDTKFRAPRMAF